MGCPLASDNGLSDFKEHSNLVKAWLRNGMIWWYEHPNTACHKTYESIYELFVSNVFFKSLAETKLAVDGGLFGEKIDCKIFLENYFNIKL